MVLQNPCHGRMWHRWWNRYTAHPHYLLLSEFNTHNLHAYIYLFWLCHTWKFRNKWCWNHVLTPLINLQVSSPGSGWAEDSGRDKEERQRQPSQRHPHEGVLLLPQSPLHLLWASRVSTLTRTRSWSYRKLWRHDWIIHVLIKSIKGEPPFPRYISRVRLLYCRLGRLFSLVSIHYF